MASGQLREGGRLTIEDLGDQFLIGSNGQSPGGLSARGKAQHDSF
jgi:hypothetical protein